MEHWPERKSGTIRTTRRGQNVRRGVESYPDDPDGHDSLHVALALGHRSLAGLATIACGGRGDLQDLVGVIDIEEQVGETEDRDHGAHVVGLTTVGSPSKIPLYARRNRAGKAGREYKVSGG